MTFVPAAIGTAIVRGAGLADSYNCAAWTRGRSMLVTSKQTFANCSLTSRLDVVDAQMRMRRFESRALPPSQAAQTGSTSSSNISSSGIRTLFYAVVWQHVSAASQRNKEGRSYGDSVISLILPICTLTPVCASASAEYSRGASFGEVVIVVERALEARCIEHRSILTRLRLGCQNTVLLSIGLSHGLSCTGAALALRIMNDLRFATINAVRSIIQGGSLCAPFG